MTKHHIINLNELTVLTLLWHVYKGSNVLILCVEPIFPPLQGVLERFANRQIKRGRAQWVMDICGELHHVRDYVVSLLYYNIYRETSAWQGAYFKFTDCEANFPNTHRALKLTSINYTLSKQTTILLLHEVQNVLPVAQIETHGIPRDTLDFYRAFYHEDPGYRIRTSYIPYWGLNVFLAAAMVLHAVFWILLRLRPFLASPRNYFLTMDFTGDPRDIRLADELSVGGDVLFVSRTRKVFDLFKERVTNHRLLPNGDGFFDFKNASVRWRDSIRDIFKITCMFAGHATPFFYKAATIPHRQSKIRAQLIRYPTQNFWGRDPYNPEHILRRVELHRVGGKSFCCLTGYGILGDVVEVLTQISVDRLYIIGRVFEEKYRDTWAEDMSVVPAGSYGLTRKKLKKMRENKVTSRDIVIFTSYLPLYQEPGLKAFIQEIAAAFPDRKIWLQLKVYFHDNDIAMGFIRECMEGYDNIEFTKATLDELIDQAGYAFSDPATIIMETIQFGLPSFVIDVVKKHQYCVFREFPHLCHSSAASAVELINNIESGSWSYPFNIYSKLIETPEISILDQIRIDMGLELYDEREDVA
jgi:hypothetical protein